MPAKPWSAAPAAFAPPDGSAAAPSLPGPDRVVPVRHHPFGGCLYVLRQLVGAEQAGDR
jgi:hypothetical protein